MKPGPWSAAKVRAAAAAAAAAATAAEETGTSLNLGGNPPAASVSVTRGGGRSMTRRPCGRLAALVFGFGLLISCRSRPRPAPPAIDVEQARQWIAQGDAHFLESHLHGWRQAEALYKKAAAASRDESVAENLRLTRFLILTRQ